jgi:hypothetical protein
MGSLDDHTDARQAQVNYVELAIAAALQGESPKVTETPPPGCRIRFARERRNP